MDIPTLKREGDSPPRETFVERYQQWAFTKTDAPVQYHMTTAMVILSAIMAPHAILETSFGEIRPNIWVMILAGTTVTRKSTSMDMALKILKDVHPDYLMGTDGSPEGLLSELSFRDGKVSLFHRDEITGFIESAGTKEYLAGLLETMTRLYDGRAEKRVLRRETIEIKEPRFIILSGGILTKMQFITSPSHIESGFIPRFLITTGSTSADEMRPIGPPTVSRQLGEHDPREDILKELFDIVNFWMPSPKQNVTTTIGGLKKKVTSKTSQDLFMTCTPQAWQRIQQLTTDATRLGEMSPSPSIYGPIYTRLANSLIKVAMLIAGSECRSGITFEDVCQAVHYGDTLIPSAIEFARGVEDNPFVDRNEKKYRKVLEYMLSRHAQGEPTTRSDLMRRFHIEKFQMERMEETMLERELIRKVTDATKRGRPGVNYTPTALAEEQIGGATFRISKPKDGTGDIGPRRATTPENSSRRNRQRAGTRSYKKTPTGEV